MRPHRAAAIGRNRRAVRTRAGTIMSAAESFFGAAPARAGLYKLLRLGLRDLRGGLRGFTAFIACLALGVMTIAGVGSLAQSLTAGLARESRVILGGDLSFILAQREAKPDERAFLARQGDVSATATMRALARTEDGRAAAGRAQSGGRALPALWRGRDRSARPARRYACTPRRRIRSGRRSIAVRALGPAARGARKRSVRRRFELRARTPERTRQARGGRRLWPAADGQR